MANGKKRTLTWILAGYLLTGCVAWHMPDPDSVNAGPVIVPEPVTYSASEQDPDSPDYCDPYCRMKRREAADVRARHRAKMECLAHPRSARLYEQGIEPCMNY